jgi:hypothetical protein
MCLCAGKGGKDKGGQGEVSHNNEKDFARRMDAWAKMKAEEAEDLNTRVGGATKS